MGESGRMDRSDGTKASNSDYWAEYPNGFLGVMKLSLPAS
jgi:hypothetical protein